MAEASVVAADLVRLPARSWALVLRELRGILAGAPAGTSEVGDAASRDELARLLSGPRSAVAAGGGRARVAELIAGDDDLLRRLSARAALADVAVLRDAAGIADVPAATTEDHAVASGPGAGRDLRAELARVRRQRDGAEARARAAEERSTVSEREVTELRARLAEAESARDAAEVELERAVGRAVRRAGERSVELERSLAAERSGREQALRDLEREREAAARLRDEVGRLRSELGRVEVAAATETVGRPVGLPFGVAPDTTEAARHLLGAVDLVVVDGYNLTLRARAGFELTEQRRWLLDRLRPVVARGPRVIVVFDGDRAAATRRATAGLDVRFTSARTIADDEIEFVAGEAAAGGIPTLVVTDDAELRRRVAAHDADVVGVLPFVGALA